MYEKTKLLKVYEYYKKIKAILSFWAYGFLGDYNFE